jgi:uncharacterized protein (TIGR02453 family)
MNQRPGFAGFPREAVQFFRGLRRNNRREWFQPRKNIFEEQVKRPMTELVEALNAALHEFAPEHVTAPERAIYRIYRDTRFSADKTPYKSHLAATFPRRGFPKNGSSGFYFSVSDSEVEVGGGVYMSERETLLAMRRHIAARHEQFRQVALNRTTRRLLGGLYGKPLSRVPKGFDATHPAADLMRYKDYILYTTLDGTLVTTPRLFSELVKRFRAMAPFVEFLSAALTPSETRPLSSERAHFARRALPVAF